MTRIFTGIAEDDLLSALRKGRIVAAGEPVQLDPYSAASDRQNSRRKFAYRVSKGKTVAFHLTAGPSLKALFEKASAFSKANPEIACKPLFFIRGGEFDLFGQEYFGETNLEEGLAQKRIDKAEWQKAVGFVKRKLAATARPSSSRRLLRELSSVEKGLLSTGRFSPFDETFLREIIFPLVRSGAASAPARIQWTNGDFIAKNILYDGKGGYRLIDYEFARETHFGELDWFRLQHHSHIPPGVNLGKLSAAPAWPPWLEILGWLEQALRLAEVNSPSGAKDGLGRIAEKLIGLLGSESPSTKGSVFAEALGRAEKQFHRTRLELEAHITILDAKIARHESDRAAIVKKSPPIDPSEAAVQIKFLEDALSTLRQKHEQLLESLQAQNDLILNYNHRS